MTPTLLLAASLTSLAPDADGPPKDETHRVEYTLKTPRSRDPVLGGARDRVFVKVWVPAGVKVVRGAVCNPFSKDEGVGKHWQAACRHWHFAYVQVDFDAVKKEEFTLLEKGMNDLAKTSGHPELARVPICFTGMSRGGGMSMNLTEMMPARTLAAVPVCLEVGPATEASRKVPVMTVFGEKDGAQMEKLTAKLPGERKEEARWGIAVQWNRKHEFGQANNLSFVFLDDVIARRLPREGAELAVIPPEEGWLGDVSSWGKDGKRAVIASWKDYKGDRDRACWFPSERTAAVWRAFVSASKDVTITEPAGLGDGQAFGSHTAGKPVTVKVNVANAVKPTKVELWDGERRVGERSAAPWEFKATLKAGIHGLYATVHEGDAVKSSRPHTIVVAE